jgi:hypothetical protein
VHHHHLPHKTSHPSYLSDCLIDSVFSVVEMNVEDLKELSRAVKALARNLATVIENPLDDYPDSLSDEEMDDELEAMVRLASVRLARHIQLAYEKGEAPLIDTILSINWQREPEGVNAASTSTSSTDRNRAPVNEDYHCEAT